MRHLLGYSTCDLFVALIVLSVFYYLDAGYDEQSDAEDFVLHVWNKGKLSLSSIDSSIYVQHIFVGTLAQIALHSLAMVLLLGSYMFLVTRQRSWYWTALLPIINILCLSVLHIFLSYDGELNQPLYPIGYIDACFIFLLTGYHIGIITLMAISTFMFYFIFMAVSKRDSISTAVDLCYLLIYHIFGFILHTRCYMLAIEWLYAECYPILSVHFLQYIDTLEYRAVVMLEDEFNEAKAKIKSTPPSHDDQTSISHTSSPCSGGTSFTTSSDTDKVLSSFLHRTFTSVSTETTGDVQKSNNDHNERSQEESFMSAEDGSVITNRNLQHNDEDNNTNDNTHMKQITEYDDDDDAFGNHLILSNQLSHFYNDKDSRRQPQQHSLLRQLSACSLEPKFNEFFEHEERMMSDNDEVYHRHHYKNSNGRTSSFQSETHLEELPKLSKRQVHRYLSEAYRHSSTLTSTSSSFLRNEFNKAHAKISSRGKNLLKHRKTTTSSFFSTSTISNSFHDHVTHMASDQFGAAFYKVSTHLSPLPSSLSAYQDQKKTTATEIYLSSADPINQSHSFTTKAAHEIHRRRVRFDSVDEAEEKKKQRYSAMTSNLLGDIGRTQLNYMKTSGSKGSNWSSSNTHHRSTLTHRVSISLQEPDMDGDDFNPPMMVAAPKKERREYSVAQNVVNEFERLLTSQVRKDLRLHRRALTLGTEETNHEWTSMLWLISQYMYPTPKQIRETIQVHYWLTGFLPFQVKPKRDDRHQHQNHTGDDNTHEKNNENKTAEDDNETQHSPMNYAAEYFDSTLESQKVSKTRKTKQKRTPSSTSALMKDYDSLIASITRSSADQSALELYTINNSESPLHAGTNYCTTNNTFSSSNPIRQAYLLVTQQGSNNETKNLIVDDNDDDTTTLASFHHSNRDYSYYSGTRLQSKSMYGVHPSSSQRNRNVNYNNRRHSHSGGRFLSPEIRASSPTMSSTTRPRQGENMLELSESPRKRRSIYSSFPNQNRRPSIPLLMARLQENSESGGSPAFMRQLAREASIATSRETASAPRLRLERFFDVNSSKRRRSKPSYDGSVLTASTDENTTRDHRFYSALTGQKIKTYANTRGSTSSSDSKDEDATSYNSELSGTSFHSLDSTTSSLDDNEDSVSPFLHNKLRDGAFKLRRRFMRFQAKGIAWLRLQGWNLLRLFRLERFYQLIAVGKFAIEAATWNTMPSSIPQSTLFLCFKNPIYEAWYLDWVRGLACSSVRIRAVIQIIGILANIILVLISYIWVRTVTGIHLERPSIPEESSNTIVRMYVIACPIYVILDLLCIIPQFFLLRLRQAHIINRLCLLSAFFRLGLSLALLSSNARYLSSDTAVYGQALFNLFIMPLGSQMTPLFPVVYFIIYVVACNITLVYGAGVHFFYINSMVRRMDIAFFHIGLMIYYLFVRSQEMSRRRLFMTSALPYLIQLMDITYKHRTTVDHDNDNDKTTVNRGESGFKFAASKFVKANKKSQPVVSPRKKTVHLNTEKYSQRLQLMHLRVQAKQRKLHFQTMCSEPIPTDYLRKHCRSHQRSNSFGIFRPTRCTSSPVRHRPSFSSFNNNNATPLNKNLQPDVGPVQSYLFENRGVPAESHSLEYSLSRPCSELNSPKVLNFIATGPPIGSTSSGSTLRPEALLPFDIKAPIKKETYINDALITSGKNGLYISSGDMDLKGVDKLSIENVSNNEGTQETLDTPYASSRWDVAEFVFNPRLQQPVIEKTSDALQQQEISPPLDSIETSDNKRSTCTAGTKDDSDLLSKNDQLTRNVSKTKPILLDLFNYAMYDYMDNNQTPPSCRQIRSMYTNRGNSSLFLKRKKRPYDYMDDNTLRPSAEYKSTTRPRTRRSAFIKENQFDENPQPEAAFFRSGGNNNTKRRHVLERPKNGINDTALSRRSSSSLRSTQSNSILNVLPHGYFVAPVLQQAPPDEVLLQRLPLKRRQEPQDYQDYFYLWNGESCNVKRSQSRNKNRSLKSNESYKTNDEVYTVYPFLMDIFKKNTHRCHSRFGKTRIFRELPMD